MYAVCTNMPYFQALKNTWKITFFYRISASKILIGILIDSYRYFWENMDASELVSQQEQEKSSGDVEQTRSASNKVPNSTISAGIKLKKLVSHSTENKPTKDAGKLTSSSKTKGKDKIFL